VLIIHAHKEFIGLRRFLGERRVGGWEVLTLKTVKTASPTLKTFAPLSMSPKGLSTLSMFIPSPVPLKNAEFAESTRKTLSY
jgi:hypothetical protein